jgi:hypothetical protein
MSTSGSLSENASAGGINPIRVPEHPRFTFDIPTRMDPTQVAVLLPYSGMGWVGEIV